MNMLGEHSVLVTELLNELNWQVSAESAFNKTRVAVSRISNGEQMPSVSSSLLEDVRLFQREFGFIGAHHDTVDQHREWSARNADEVIE
jgi:hypothetical protein